MEENQPKSKDQILDEECESLRDLLSLVMDPFPSRVEVKSWSEAERKLATEWAVAAHLRASDNNDVEAKPIPPIISNWQKNNQTIVCKRSDISVMDGLRESPPGGDKLKHPIHITAGLTGKQILDGMGISKENRKEGARLVEGMKPTFDVKREMEDNMDKVREAAETAFSTDNGRRDFYPMPRVVAMDFDGVIHLYEGWKGRETVNCPVDLEGMRREFDILRANGWKIIVWTSRGDLNQVETFLNDHSIIYDAINHNQWAPENVLECRKIVADVYVDDSAVEFYGVWAGLADRVMHHTRWWQKPSPEAAEPVEKLKGIVKVVDVPDLREYHEAKEEMDKYGKSHLNWDNDTTIGQIYREIFYGEGVGHTFLNANIIMPSEMHKLRETIEMAGRWAGSFEGVKQKAEAIFCSRNSESGGRWRDVGLRGAFIEIHAKLSRLKDNTEGIDKHNDNLIDLYNYCCISMMCIKAGLIQVAQRTLPAIVTGCQKGGLGEVIRETLNINGYITIPISLEQREVIRNDLDAEYFRRMMGDVESHITQLCDKEEIAHVDFPPILINNYGVNYLSWIGDIGDIGYEVIDKNLKWPLMVVDAYYYQFGAYIRRIKKGNGRNASRILNVCSQTYRVAQRCTSAYCASKAGLAHLTKVMAREMGPNGVIVNGIAPGLIQDTTMAQKTNDQVRSLRGWKSEDADRYAKTLIPLGRYTTREEVANAIMKILQLPDYITGAVIDMTGGQ